MKQLRQNKKFRVYCRQMFSTLLVVIATFCIWDLDPQVKSAILVFWIPALNLTLKYINTEYLWDLWVDVDWLTDQLWDVISTKSKKSTKKK